MDDNEDEACTNTFSDAILVEFTDTASRNLEEAKREPRLGRPSPEILEERAREAARFLEELEREKKSKEKPLDDDKKQKQ